MARLTLSFIGGSYDWIQPLLESVVQPEGIELAVTRAPAPEAMRRQIKFEEFDVCEMALGTYLAARERGRDWTGIPVFPLRSFWHTQFSCNADAGISEPGDLSGKRLGIAEYLQSSSIWARGILQHDFGVLLPTVHWYAERSGDGSTGAVLGFAPPEGVSVQQVPQGKTLATMLAAGELHAAAVAPGGRPNLRPLFPDLVAEGARFFKQHGYIPANHIYVLRGAVLRDVPWAALNLYQAFAEAKGIAQRRLTQTIPPGLVFGAHYLAQTRALFGDDPFPYGLSANWRMVERMIQCCHEQGVMKEKPAVEALFATSTLDT